MSSSGAVCRDGRPLRRCLASLSCPGAGDEVTASVRSTFSVRGTSAVIASSLARLRNRAAAMARQPAGTRQLVARHARSGVKRLALAVLVAFAVPTAGAGAATHAIALFPTASSPNWAGFARVINHSDEPGTVRIVGIDDAGSESGPIELSLEAKATAHFNSADLEEGNADKGLSRGLGAGEGDWRLRFESELAIEVLSYIRTGDGFVTAMHEVVPEQGRLYHVRFFNPGSNTSQVSRLRLVNPTGDEVEVSIEGRDDDGEPAPGGAARLMIPPGEARTLTAQALESGGAELTGGLGDGTGKWQLFITADAAIEVMNLLETPTGHLSNLSAPGLRDVSEGRREQELALFMSESNEGRVGFARLLNHSEESGTVRIYGIDDEGEWFGPVTLSLEAGAAAHFNSRDLERGNAEKGLSGALGVGFGNWRLRLYTELDLESLAYVRTGDGFVTTMHERVRESAMRHHVAFFNPGSNRSQVSRLRLINPTEEDVEVTIAGRDDDGAAAPGGEVSLTLGPGEARMLSAQELEEGGAGLAGSLGDGSGKWQLFVSADGSIEVMNLLRSPTGHLANLSASSQEGVVNEDGIDEPVALNVIVDIPPEVTSVRASDLETTVLGAGDDGVPPGGVPALLVASDADGAVMYALVDEDGGLLGEAQGTVRVSVASTAVVVVALAAGYRIPSVTPEAVEAILSHAEFGALTRQLTRLMGEDKNYLVRLSDYPDVVAVIQRMARSLSGAASPARAKASAAVVRAAPPGGNVKADFYCMPLTRKPCSPWDAHEPWRWFGNARGAEVFKPDGKGFIDFLLSITSLGVGEAYIDILEEATDPPFLARSDAEASRERHAAANPGFVGYAMELYEGSQFRDWYYVPGNSTAVDKIRNSGAAYREVRAGDDQDLSPDIDRIRFQRYRLTGRADGEGFADRAAVVSFLNTMRFAASVANVATNVSAVEEWLDGLARDPRSYLRIGDCARAYTKLSLGTNDPNESPTEQMVAFFRDNAGALFGTLLSNSGCRGLLREAGGERLENMLRELITRASLEVVVNVLTGVKPAVDVVNETALTAVSYFAPGAARSEYYVHWGKTPGGQAYIARVSQRPLPVAEFTYTQQQDSRVELDGSMSEGDGLSYEWRVGRERIGTGPTLVHDFGEKGVFDVTLKVTDRSGLTAEEHYPVRVTAGRVPEVESLTCTPTGRGKAFSMRAEFADGDDNIESVQWYSSISNARPDRETGAGTGSVTLSAPDDATYTRAKVRVVDARGNAAERNCPVEFEAAPPAPGIDAVSAEEGEALEFTVTLDRVPDEPVTYYYATYRFTARTDDYDGHLATALRFAPGERSKPITVLTTEDTRVERDETFYVYITDERRKLTNNPPRPGEYLDRATGTIRDDDRYPAAEPDLVVSSASLGASTVEQGDRIRVDATVTNRGSGKAGSSRVGYYVGKTSLIYVGDDSVSSLDPGESDDEYVYIDTDDLEPGIYFVMIKADYEGDVTESNENNNVYSGINFRFVVTASAEPDLVVSSASLGASTVEQGDRIRVDATVTNRGSGKAGSSRVGYYVGKTSLIYVGDDSVSSLDPGESDDEYVYIDTDDLEPGIYFVMIKADYEGDVTESNENNNVYSGINFRFVVTASAEPDLVVSSASLGASTVEQGDRIRVDATVTNRGSGKAGSSRVGYYVGKTSLIYVGDDSVSSLDPGESDDEYVYIDTDDLEPGIYFVMIKADYEGDVTESNENNNVYSGINFRFVVTASAEPDLVVSSASLGASTVEQGDRIRVDATVTNRGSGKAGSSRVGYYVGKTSLIYVGDDSVSSLDPGESDDEYVYIDTDDLEPGIYFVMIKADYEGDVTESNESNNVYSGINFRFVVTAP